MIEYCSPSLLILLSVLLLHKEGCCNGILGISQNLGGIKKIGNLVDNAPFNVQHGLVNNEDIKFKADVDGKKKLSLSQNMNNTIPVVKTEKIQKSKKYEVSIIDPSKDSSTRHHFKQPIKKIFNSNGHHQSTYHKVPFFPDRSAQQTPKLHTNTPALTNYKRSLNLDPKLAISNSYQLKRELSSADNGQFKSQKRVPLTSKTKKSIHKGGRLLASSTNALNKNKQKIEPPLERQPEEPSPLNNPDTSPLPLRKYQTTPYLEHPTSFIESFISDNDAETKGCKSIANACCAHKNNSCWSFGPRKNNPLSSICYCDEACKLLGDCCTDYEAVCVPVDCVLANEWEEWSKCNSSCGIGVRQRRREILVQPKNFGKPCGSTLQKSVCDGNECKNSRSSSFNDRETALILPGEYALHRSSDEYHPLKDLRKNFYLRNSPNEADDLHRPSVCMRFEIVDVKRHCGLKLSNKNESIWIDALKTGMEVCVECQSTAMNKEIGSRCKGQGVVGVETRWSAFGVPGCQGRWVLKNKPEICQCDLNQENSFVLI